MGDGHTDRASITNTDEAIVQYCHAYAKTLGLKWKVHDNITYSYMADIGDPLSEEQFNSIALRILSNESVLDIQDSEKRPVHVIHAVREHIGQYGATAFASFDNREYRPSRLSVPNTLFNKLASLGVIGHKHIPECYLKNSREVRLKVLAGVIDADGSCDASRYDIRFGVERVFDDVMQLARSLGFKTTKRKYLAKCYHKDGRVSEHDAWRGSILGGNSLCDVPVLLNHKKIQKKIQRYDLYYFDLQSQ